MAATVGLENPARLASDRGSQQAFLGVSALFLGASTAVTIAWCTSMSATGGMPMPGGWTMSMAWMRMPGQRWLGVALSFLGMWVAMMVAMMLPSLVPMLLRYRRGGRQDTPRHHLGLADRARGVAITLCGPSLAWWFSRWVSH